MLIRNLNEVHLHPLTLRLIFFCSLGMFSSSFFIWKWMTQQWRPIFDATDQRGTKNFKKGCVTNLRYLSVKEIILTQQYLAIECQDEQGTQLSLENAEDFCNQSCNEIQMHFLGIKGERNPTESDWCMCICRSFPEFSNVAVHKKVCCKFKILWPCNNCSLLQNLC